jgi:hypothetical protein
MTKYGVEIVKVTVTVTVTENILVSSEINVHI